MKKEMICTRCGSTKTWLENQLIFCARLSRWRLRRDEIVNRMEQIVPWIISLCFACAHNNYKELLTEKKDDSYWFMTKMSPILFFSGLGVAVIAVLLAGSLGGVGGSLQAVRLTSTILSVFLITSLLGGGIAVAIAVIGFPINFITYQKSRTKLNRMLTSDYQFSESEKTEAVYNEGNRIIDCIKTKSQNYYGDYALPEPRSWSKPPFDHTVSDASHIDWSFKIVTPNEIMECINGILSMFTVSANHELYSLCDDFIEQLHRTNKIDEKYYSKLKIRIINNREESKQHKDKIEKEVMTDVLIAILSEGPEEAGRCGAFKPLEVRIPEYIKALNRTNKELQKAAVNALEFVTGEKFGVDEHRWHEWWQDNENKTKVYERIKVLYPNKQH